MPTIEVFDPAMCCSTGVCGPSVDPELARFEADLRWLGARGAEVVRYNLAQEPGAFANRPVIAALMASGGEDVLPIVLIDGAVRFSGTRPSRHELAGPAGLSTAAAPATLEAVAPSCGPADQDGCC